MEEKPKSVRRPRVDYDDAEPVVRLYDLASIESLYHPSGCACHDWSHRCSRVPEVGCSPFFRHNPHVRSWQGSEEADVKSCLECKAIFEAENDRKVFCSGRCRAEASRRRRQRELTAALDEVQRAIAKARAAAFKNEEEP